MKLLNLTPKKKIALFPCACAAVFGLLFFLSPLAASAGTITISGIVHGTDGNDATGSGAFQNNSGNGSSGSNGGNGSPVTGGPGSNGGDGASIIVGIFPNSANAGD